MAEFEIMARSEIMADKNILGAIVATFANPFVWIIWATAYDLSASL